MALTKKQKKFIRNNINKLSLGKIASTQKLSEDEVLDYLASIWSKKKFEAYRKKLAKDEVFQVPKQGQGTLGEWLRQQRWVILGLVGLVIIVYFNSIDNGFVSDDMTGIVNNPRLGDWGYVFRKPLLFLRPLFYYLIHLVFGQAAFAYRLLNIGFHLGSVLLIYAIVQLLHNQRVALITAALFAVHPILVEAVTWISGGPYAQFTFFFLLSFLLYLLRDRGRYLYLLSLLAFVLCVVSSEKSFIVFGIFFLYEFANKQLQTNWRKLVPYLGMGVGFGLFYVWQIGARTTDLATRFYAEGGTTNPLIQVPVALTRYFELLFWPQNLTLYQTEFDFLLTNYWLTIVVTGIYGGLLVYAYFKQRKYFFWLAFFLIPLLPFLTPFRISWIVAERYAYLSVLGLLVVVAMLIDRPMRVPGFKWVGIGLISVMLLGLSVRTIARNQDWQDRDTLWFATAELSPSSPNVHNNLGDVYARRSEYENAIREFQRAIELKPGYADAYHNLANVYATTGEFEQAITNYQKALEFNPNLWQSHAQLAAIYYNQSDYVGTKEQLTKALEVFPNNLELLLQLGVIHEQLGEIEQAKEVYHLVLQADPTNAEVAERLQLLYTTE